LQYVSSVYYLFFIGTDAACLPDRQACLPQAGSPLIISVCIKICYGSFHLFTFYFLAVTNAACLPDRQVRH
jgi:hypothetical protein